MKTVGQYNIMTILVLFGCIFVPFVTSQVEQCPNSPRPADVNGFKILESTTNKLSEILEGKPNRFKGSWTFTPPEDKDVLTNMVTMHITYQLDAHKRVCSIYYKPYLTLADDQEAKPIQEKFLPKGKSITAEISFEGEICTDYKAGEKGILVFQLVYDSFENDGLCVYAETEVQK